MYELEYTNNRFFSSRFYERFPGDTASAEDQATLYFTLLSNEVR